MTKPRILIVEDEPFVARDIRQQLMELGYEPVADTPLAEEAISLTEQLRPDLVLMDIHLEGEMDGISAAQVIHDRFDLPVVFLTAFASEETLDRAKKSDPFGYIIKPFDERELRTVIEMALYKHQAETELRQSREEQAAILRTTLDGFWLVDMQGHILDVNEACCRMHGYTRDEMLGKSITEFEADENASEIAAGIERVQQVGSALLERRHRCKDGHLIDVEVSINYLPGGTGRFSTFLRDITERKLVEQALRRSEERATKTFRTIPDGIVISRLADGQVVEVNEGFCRLSCMSREEVLGHSMLELDLWDQLFDRDKFINALREQGRVEGMEAGFHNRSGGHRIITLSAEVMDHDQDKLILTIAHDITERKQAEEALRESEETYRSILNASPDDITITDLEGRILMVSPAAHSMFGYEPGEEIGLQLLDFIVPEDLERARSNLMLMYQGGYHKPNDYRGVRKDRSLFDIEVNSGFIRGTDGQPTKMVFIVRDITERKLADEALRENEDRYRDLIDNSMELISTYDLEGNIISANETMVRISGYPREALLKMNMTDLMVPKMRHLFPEYLRTLRTDEKAQGIMRIQTAHGETRFWEYESTLRTEGVAVPIVRGMGLDITERRQAEKALRASEAQLQVILESTDDGILAVDLHAKILKTNRRFAEIWGIPQSLIAGGDDQALLDYVLAQLCEPDAFLKKVQSLYASDAKDLDLIHFKDGRCFERFSSPMLEGSVLTGRVSFFRNITERKLAEAALRENEDRYCDLVDNSLELITTNALDGNILSANETAIRVTGYPLEALLKMNMADLVVPKMRHMFPEYLKTLVEVGKAHGIMQIQTAQGDIRFWEYTSSVRTEGVAQPVVRAMALDITERRQAEKALRASESQLQVILESTDDGILAVDHHGKVLKTNRRLADLWKIPQSIIASGERQALLDYVLLQLSDPDAFLKKAHSLQASNATDLDLIHFKDGRCFERLSSPLLEESVITGRVSSFRDITERKRAEEALHESERMLKESQVIAGLGSYALDVSSGIWKSSDVLDNLFGIDDAFEHSTEGWASLIHPDDRPWMVDYLTNEVIGKHARFDKEYRIIRNNDQAERWVHGLGKIGISAEDQQLKMHGTIQDITERKRAEVALRESHERFELANRATFNIIWDWDVKTNVVWRNDNFQKLFGYSRDDVKTSYEASFDLIHPEDLESVEAGIQAAIDARSEFWADQYRFRRKDGSYATVEDRAIITRDADGHAIRMLGAMQDISERKQAEKSLKEGELRYRTLFQANPHPMWVYDRETLRFLMVNHAAVSHYGYSQDEFLAMTIKDIRPSGEIPRLQATLANMATESIHTSGYWRHQKRDGTIIDVEITSHDMDFGGRLARVVLANDITARLRAETSLRLQGAALEAAANAIIITDRHGVTEWANAAFTTMTGYSVDEAIGKRPGDLLKSGKHDAAFYSAMWSILHAGEVWQGEIINRRKDGSHYPEEMSITPLMDDRGEITHFVAIKQDITQRKQAELERQNTDARIREQASLLDKAHDAILVRDLDGRILFWNKGAERLYGWTSEELIGRPAADLFFDDLANFHEPQALLLAEGEWDGRLQQRRKDGNLLTIAARWTLVRDEQGQPRSILAINTDITERVEAEHELQQYTERLEAMRAIDAAILGARSTTELAQGALARLRHIVPFDRASVVLFDQGLTEGTILAVDQHQPWLPLAGEVRPIGDFHDLKDLLLAPFLDLSDLSDIQGCAMEERMLSQGLRSIVYVPMESEGTVLGFVALSSTTPGLLNSKHAEIALDMTDQLVVAIQHTRLKEELELSNQLLESKVEKRTAELRTTVATMQVLEGVLRQQEAEARAASEAKSTFLSSMSHELRTPLIGVTGMLEVLRQSDLDAEQRQVVAIIHESSESLLQIIGDILDFSKIEADKLELAPQTFSARALLESVSQTFRSALSAKGLKFIVEVDPRLAPAHVADALRIRQILNNLMSNAVKFTERGSITLRLRLVESSASSESLAFEVKDTGIGVSRENQAKLFEPFTQAEASTTRRFGGTGLGLVISHQLAELMGGSLNMQSTLGQGTTMTLAMDLPLGDVRDIAHPNVPDVFKAVPVRPAPSIEAAMQERSLVLMAEDHPTNRIVLIQQVNRAGFALEVAVDGQEAFEKWQSGRYALILTDLHMPRMDGYQLTKAVRDWERAHEVPRTPILALTANALRGEAARCLELGMDDFLIKPVTIPLLASKLHQWMPHVKHDETPEAQVAPSIPSPMTVEWVPGVDSKTLLDLCGGDAASAQEILNDFIATTKADLLVMQDGLQKKDRPCIVRQAHRIKGSAAMIGARDLADKAKKLEACAKTETAGWETMKEHLVGLQEELKGLDRVE